VVETDDDTSRHVQALKSCLHLGGHPCRAGACTGGPSDQDLPAWDDGNLPRHTHQLAVPHHHQQHGVVCLPADQPATKGWRTADYKPLQVRAAARFEARKKSRMSYSRCELVFNMSTPLSSMDRPYHHVCLLSHTPALTYASDVRDPLAMHARSAHGIRDGRS
jgi:hypothetical protein